MHDMHRLAIFVRRFIHVGQRFSHLGRDIGPHLQRKALRDLDSATSQLGQRLATDVLHGDEVGFFFAGDVIDVDDVGMVQHGGDARFAQKHVHHRLMLRPTRLQDLEHQFLAECPVSLVSGKEDLRHSTCGQMLDQGVGTEPGAFEFLRACHAICRMRTNYHSTPRLWDNCPASEYVPSNHPSPRTQR